MRAESLQVNKRYCLSSPQYALNGRTGHSAAIDTVTSVVAFDRAGNP